MRFVVLSESLVLLSTAYFPSNPSDNSVLLFLSTQTIFMPL